MPHIRALALALLAGFAPGCGGTRPPTTPAPAAPGPPVTIRSDPGEARTFEAGAEIPPASFAFEGAPGFVRTTLEAESSSEGRVASASLNDALFRASGRGRLVVSFRKPWAGHDEGRVTVRCEGGSEDSSAEFEPALWSRDPGAVVAFEAPAPGPITPGREAVLARWAAKLGSKAVGLTLKATFAATPPPVRLKAPGGSQPR